jgi:hypothetical protein
MDGGRETQNVVINMNTIVLNESNTNQQPTLSVNKVSNNNFIRDVSVNEIIIEYNNFKNKQCLIIEKLKKMQQIISKDLQDNKLTNLDNYLSSKNYLHKKTFTCDLCKLYESNTKKGIAAHKKGCKKKYNIGLI